MIVSHTLLPLTLLALCSPSLTQAQKPPIQITADLSEAPRKLYHAEVDIPVKPGPVSLTTPKWIPGNHRPSAFYAADYCAYPVTSVEADQARATIGQGLLDPQ